ncbi:hypothetical protein XELAEV_18034850mg [Xenopus laevis]|uniref:Uncharacterized protein n=1 Tax=Xenopus laevis TaxID=8355 RepID=A0A974CER0_XENLA|nr:hypothetical protein XELAEV_18034850mg [Xenopus laevis]
MGAFTILCRDCWEVNEDGKVAQAAALFAERKVRGCLNSGQGTCLEYLYLRGFHKTLWKNDKNDPCVCVTMCLGYKLSCNGTGLDVYVDQTL